MGKIRFIFVGVLAFLGSMVSVSYAGNSLIDQDSYGTTSDMSADEQVFETMLDDENVQLFSQMSSKKKKEAMNMAQMMDATGVLLSPNEAVSKVASTDTSGGD